VTFFDTAQLYGKNEQLLVRALQGRAKNLVIATKFGFRFDAAGNACGPDSSPANIRAVCEKSLRNLQVDTIDLFYQHRVDPAVPMADVAGNCPRGAGLRRHLARSASDCV
jgi:aryl-alcohol dehydrogenase-like predicted oxidoreductase